MCAALDPRGGPEGGYSGRRKVDHEWCICKLEARTLAAGDGAGAGQEGGEPVGWERPFVFLLQTVQTSGVSSPDTKDRSTTKTACLHADVQCAGYLLFPSIH